MILKLGTFFLLPVASSKHVAHMLSGDSCPCMVWIQPPRQNHSDPSAVNLSAQADTWLLLPALWALSLDHSSVSLPCYLWMLALFLTLAQLTLILPRIHSQSEPVSSFTAPVPILAAQWDTVLKLGVNIIISVSLFLVSGESETLCNPFFPRSLLKVKAGSYLQFWAW